MNANQQNEIVECEVIATINDILGRVTSDIQVANGVASETYRVINSEMIDISSDSESDSSSSSESESSDESECKQESSCQTKNKKIPVTKGELTVYDLPPIENLNITLPVEDLDHMGRISSIIDFLVVVQSFKNKPVMNLDSVLFMKNGSPLGHVFDVFGPVVAPLYSIRFNSSQEITERNITIDAPVFYAPNYSSPITDYVFYQQLLAAKGSDASWRHNNEPPSEFVDFSDDEEERMAKMKMRAKRKFGDNHKSYRVPPNTPNSPRQMMNNNISLNSKALNVPHFQM
ncbi:H/ACA ribonucleoprotein complex non-core subunit NAF1-like protein [Leptotrombidium deliense]|uniref:H/ACA ribonucleoprotein complex subunit n=1 Tax=Leptotrombidium deliense TaxID=299467 RepID=A0A443SUT4_9ACAR|nr:H/ACA ribonucleoprotein complex non-core subunit NAF1-like protein [Leptotrombidium deliense]